MNIYPKNSFGIYHTVKSGGHPVVYWIAGQISDFVYINNFDPNYNFSDHIVLHWKYGLKDYVPHFYNISKQADWVKGEYSKFKNTNTENFIYTLEDDSYKIDFKGVYPQNKYKIIVLRDPYNWLASRFKSFDGLYSLKSDRIMGDPIGIWKEHAKAILEDKNVIPVIFNKWFYSKEYRINLSKTLNLNFSDKNLQFVSSYNNGSSFDGINFDGNAQFMDIFNRWQFYKTDEEYLSLFDKELLELSDIIFPETIPFKTQLGL